MLYYILYIIYYILYIIGFTPDPVTVNTRIIAFLVGNAAMPVNLYLPLLLGQG